MLFEEAENTVGCCVKAVVGPRRTRHVLSQARGHVHLSSPPRDIAKRPSCAKKAGANRTCWLESKAGKRLVIVI